MMTPAMFRPVMAWSVASQHVGERSRFFANASVSASSDTSSPHGRTCDPRSEPGNSLSANRHDNHRIINLETVAVVSATTTSSSTADTPVHTDYADDSRHAEGRLRVRARDRRAAGGGASGLLGADARYIRGCLLDDAGADARAAAGASPGPARRALLSTHRDMGEAFDPYIARLDAYQVLIAECPASA